MGSGITQVMQEWLIKFSFPALFVCVRMCVCRVQNKELFFRMGESDEKK